MVVFLDYVEKIKLSSVFSAEGHSIPEKMHKLDISNDEIFEFFGRLLKGPKGAWKDA